MENGCPHFVPDKPGIVPARKVAKRPDDQGGDFVSYTVNGVDLAHKYNACTSPTLESEAEVIAGGRLMGALRKNFCERADACTGCGFYPKTA